MPKRFSINQGDWESITLRLQELVLANSGEDEFQEIFKIFVAKIFSEINGKHTSLFSYRDKAEETAENINQLLALAADKWRGIIQDSPKSNLSNEHLKICVREIENYSLLNTHFDAIDSLFEFLINRVAKGSKGQYFTPRQIIECCVRILAPKETDIIVDPACGSGGFLIHALNYVRSGNNNLKIKNFCDGHIWGFDFDKRVIQVAKALMLLAGDGSSNIFQLNSLRRSSSNDYLPGLEHLDLSNSPQITIEDVMRTRTKKFKGFDIVLTNPPFAGEILEPDLLASYELSRAGRRMERDVLFLERCIDLLKPGGRLCIVIPHNKLAGESWTYVREWLLSNLRVVAVLGLPRNTFLPHTHQKTSVIFGLRRARPEKNINKENVLFLISERSGKDNKGKAIKKSTAKQNESIWFQADHDLEDAIALFEEFVNKNNIPWSVSQNAA